MSKSLNRVHKEIEKEKLLKEITGRVIPKIQAVYTAAIIITLHDKYDFGVKRCGDAIEKIMEVFEDIYDERISLNDIRRVVSESIGIDLVEFEKLQEKYYADKTKGLEPEPIKVPKIKPKKKEQNLDCSNLRKYMEEKRK